MRTVGIKTLKNKLSHYVRMAAAGETVLISDRDKVVAELVAPRASRSREVHDAVLADLIRSGVLCPALVASGAPPSGESVMTWSELEQELGADREDR